LQSKYFLPLKYSPKIERKPGLFSAKRKRKKKGAILDQSLFSLAKREGAEKKEIRSTEDFSFDCPEVTKGSL
jgi:hypothetical protein